MKKFKPFIPILIIIAAVLFLFKPFIFGKSLPIPSDTIVGLYYPLRDLYASTNPRGVPFHNSLITDPIRQQYPWRSLAIEEEKNLTIPLWNPYSFAGMPFAANGQTAAMYPLNIVFFLLPFTQAWSLLILLEPLLGGIFLYLYLRNLHIRGEASLVGSLAFAFSGFFVAWMEWNTVVQVALWLPLVLLSIDRIFIFFQKNSKLKIQDSKLQLRIQKYYVWSGIFVFSLITSFLAGHLQTSFYVMVITFAYFIARWIQQGFDKKILILFLVLFSIFFLITSIHIVELLQFINVSARNVDQNWHQIGWFIPWQNLVQFVAPDFFGNPATGNYWGIWNYAEFLGYIGLVPLIFSLFALFFRHDKKTLFFGTLFFLSLIFSLPTIFAKAPFYFSIPFLSNAQPTRLLFVADFSLAILSAFGLDYFLKSQTKKIIYPLLFIASVFAGMWFVVLFNSQLHVISSENMIITRHNIFLPTVLFVISFFCMVSLFFVKQKRFLFGVYCLLLFITVLDLYRFASKFETFASAKYLFPQTKILNYLQKNAGNYRVMTTDDQILPPNFSIMYHIQTLDGYDPLYLRTYGELIAAMGRMKPDISTPFGFNRIITPHSYTSFVANLLGVKYVLSLSDVKSPGLEKILQDGQTRLYSNKNVIARAFFVSKVITENNKQDAIQQLFSEKFDPQTTAVVTCESCSQDLSHDTFSIGNASITRYTPNVIHITSNLSSKGFLVLTDNFYPTWHASVDGKDTKIFLTDYTLRGIVVPAGEHTITFYETLF